MQELVDLLTGGAEHFHLDRAALQLASIEYPGLEPGPFLDILDSYAVELAARLPGGGDGPEYIRAANEFLFEELGFRGNTENYYDPRNSCLNYVLTERVGIPITLSVVLIEISRRLSKPVFGIGLPGHFIVEYRDSDYRVLLDPFHGGRILTTEECYALARQMTGADFSKDPAVLQPVANRQMLVRMLNNLRAVYLSRGADRKALEVVNLLIAANPDSAEDYRYRAAIHTRLKRFAPAKSDMEKYLALSPDAPDRREAEAQIQALRNWLAGMN